MAPKLTGSIVLVLLVLVAPLDGSSAVEVSSSELIGVEGASDDGKYWFRLSASSISGQAGYVTEDDNYIMFPFYVDKFLSEPFIGPMTDNRTKQHVCKPFYEDHRLIGVKLQLDAKLPDGPDSKVASKTVNPEAAPKDIGPFELLLVFGPSYEPYPIGSSSLFYQLAGYVLTVKVNKSSNSYGNCWDEAIEHERWNEVEMFKKRFCPGYQCSESRLVMENHFSDVYVDFEQLKVMLTNSDGKYDQGQCYQPCTDDLPSTHSTDYFHRSGRYMQGMLNVFGYCLALTVFLLVITIVLRWKRECKEHQRQRALLPRVGYFCPPRSGAPNQSGQQGQMGVMAQSPALNTLYIIPPPQYGMDGTDTKVEKETAGNMVFH